MTEKEFLPLTYKNVPNAPKTKVGRVAKSLFNIIFALVLIFVVLTVLLAWFLDATHFS